MIYQLKIPPYSRKLANYKSRNVMFLRHHTRLKATINRSNRFMRRFLYLIDLFDFLYAVTTARLPIPMHLSQLDSRFVYVSDQSKSSLLYCAHSCQSPDELCGNRIGEYQGNKNRRELKKKNVKTKQKSMLRSRWLQVSAIRYTYSRTRYPNKKQCVCLIHMIRRDHRHQLVDCFSRF